MKQGEAINYNCWDLLLTDSRIINKGSEVNSSRWFESIQRSKTMRDVFSLKGFICTLCCLQHRLTSPSTYKKMNLHLEQAKATFMEKNLSSALEGVAAKSNTMASSTNPSDVLRSLMEHTLLCAQVFFNDPLRKRNEHMLHTGFWLVVRYHTHQVTELRSSLQHQK